MLVKEILNLINKYNEDGIIVECENKFYWFNGSRYEFWCLKPQGASHPVYYKSKLYVKIDLLVYEYKNKKFILSLNEDVLVTSLLHFKYRCLYKENVYDFLNVGKKLWRIGKFGNWMQIDQEKPSYSGLFLFGYENCIYVIGDKNEKFNLLTSSWSTFKKTPFLMTNGCFLNDKFYNLSEEDTFINYYDPKIDQWI